MMFFSQKEAWDAADPRRGPPPQRTSQQEGTMNTSTHPLGTLIETDVLVIGSGASGCGAALGAREQASWKAPAASAAGMTTIWRSSMRKASRTMPPRI